MLTASRLKVEMSKTGASVSGAKWKCVSAFGSPRSVDTSVGETQQVRKESDVIADVPAWMLAIVVVADITRE